MNNFINFIMNKAGVAQVESAQQESSQILRGELPPDMEELSETEASVVSVGLLRLELIKVSDSSYDLSVRRELWEFPSFRGKSF